MLGINTADLAAFFSGPAPIIVALVALVGTVLNAVVNQRLARSTQRDVEQLRGAILEQHAERATRRDYEYEARKSLYTNFEPLRFQLFECCDAALGNILSLADQARQGNLGAGGWLSRDTYFLKATIYQLLSPAAVYRMMVWRLTLVDLQLDAALHVQYLLARTIYQAFTDDALFAHLLACEYTPYVPDWREKRKTNPAVFRRQGFPRGRLDSALVALIEREGSQPRIVTFGKFEEQLQTVAESDVSSALGTARDVFFEFDPHTRPVLWQILLTQASLYRCIVNGGQRWDEIRDIAHSIGGADSAGRYLFSATGAGEREQFVQSSKVASDYLDIRLRPPLQRVLN